MAFGKGSIYPPGTKIYSFNLKDKDLPAPQFDVLTKKDGEDKPVKVDTATRVSGNLIGVKHRENKHENKVIASVTATIQDKNEIYYVSIPYTFLGRNIMNSMSALKTFDEIDISVYKGKPKNPGQPGFSSSAVRQDGQLVYGKYEHKDLPPIPKVKVGGNLFGDSTAIDALFKKEIDELEARIKAKAPVVANEEAAPTADAAPESGPESSKDDLPF